MDKITSVSIFLIMLALVLLLNGCNKDKQSQATSSKEVEIAECAIPDGETYYGLGFACTSTQDCKDTIDKIISIFKSAGADEEVEKEFSQVKENIKCMPTHFERIKEGNLYVSCNAIQDCYEQIGTGGLLHMFGMDGVLNEDIEKEMKDSSVEERRAFNSLIALDNEGLKSVVRCNKNFCEGTEKFLDFKAKPSFEFSKGTIEYSQNGNTESSGIVLPASCVLFPGVSCADFKINTTTITLMVRNGIGDTLNPFIIKIPPTASACVNAGAIASDGLTDGETETLYITCPTGNSGARFKTDLTMTYATSDGETHTRTGMLVYQIE